MLDILPCVQEFQNDDAKYFVAVMQYKSSRLKSHVVVPVSYCIDDAVLSEFGKHLIRQAQRTSMVTGIYASEDDCIEKLVKIFLWHQMVPKTLVNGG